MKAMLLAAGLGMRLRPLTDNLPKCMIPVAGKPVLQHNIEWLRAEGIRELVINLHHYPEAVRNYFGDGRAFGVRIKYSYEPELLGTAGAVRQARNLLGMNRFLVVYADNLLDCSLQHLRRLHLTRQATLSMVLFWRQTNVSASSTVSFETDGRITAFKEKPGLHEIQTHWISAGLLLCEPAVFDFIPAGQFVDFGHTVFPALLQANKPVYGYPMRANESLRWIDTPADLAQTELFLQEKALAQVV
jgi:NDP-sugar pyrophosphorylase family protein